MTDATIVPGEWTPERLALLRARFPTCGDTKRLWQDINALPGAPFSAPRLVRMKANKLGMARSAALVQAIQVAAGRSHGVLGAADGAQAAFLSKAARKSLQVVTGAADPGIARYEKARALLGSRKSNSEVMSSTGLPLREVLRIRGELQREKVAA